MDCLKCGNCNSGERTYYCIKDGDFVINSDFEIKGKERNTWNKEDFRKIRKEKAAQKV